MKYSIPIVGNKGLDERVSEHFGRAPYYAIWNEETDEIEILDNSSEHFGGRGLPAELLAQYSDGILCGGIGSRAISLCEQLGLKVYVGAYGTVREVIAKFKEGKLKEATSKDGCNH
ncbi:MAG: NifB/NifX family molybdenum-iron cluster-binding protein [Candidatus Heimdallarchaeaceae archaeon]